MRALLPSLAASFIIVAGCVACSAAGSSTVIAGPDSGSDGRSGFADDDSGTVDEGGSGATDYAALFGPPASTNATPGSIMGLWAGSDGSEIDTRLVISASSLIIAKKCTDASLGPPQGITVVSQNSSSAIRTLESKAGPGSSGLTCGLNVTPVSMPRCTSLSETDAENEAQTMDGGCFYLSGTNLTFNSTKLLSGLKLTKLSD